MTQLSQNETKVSDIPLLVDKQQAGFDIEQLVSNSEMGYLEATSQWLQENSLTEHQFAKYIPQVIIDKIKDEAISDNMLRPSISKTEKTNTLDFLL